MGKSLKNAFDGTFSKIRNALGFEQVASISLVGTEEEKQRLTNIANRMAKSELGWETLNIAAKSDYSIEFNKSDGSGFANHETKTISINPNLSDDMLVMVLAHEARHAGQFIRDPSLSKAGKTSIKTMIMIDRATEADAERTACVVGRELKEKGDDAPYYDLCFSSPLIVMSFEKAIAEGSNADMAAFKGWYDNESLKATYEKAYIVERLSSFQTKCIDDKMKFNKARTSKEIVDKVCFIKGGKGYFTDDPKILENPKFLDVEQKTMDFIKKFMATRKIVYGFEPDKNLNEIPVRPSSKSAHTVNKELLQKLKMER